MPLLVASLKAASVDDLTFNHINDGTEYSVSGCVWNASGSLGIPGTYNVTVTSIGDWAFYNCSSLTSIAIPERVTLIGDSAFFGCTSLINIYIERVTLIGSGAFIAAEI